MFFVEGGKEWSECALSKELCGDALPDYLWPQFQKKALTGKCALFSLAYLFACFQILLLHTLTLSLSLFVSLSLFPGTVSSGHMFAVCQPEAVLPQ